jgi:hypothetical protein
MVFLHWLATKSRKAGLTWLGLEPTIYSTWGEYANHYITDVVIHT